jgi:radical SAM superfamily enzyme YgiQ (UPF0313 family)
VNILLVYPKFPENNFWSSAASLWFVRKKSAMWSLSLPTIAAMSPRSWNQELVDMNIEHLLDRQIKKADMVFISAMIVQEKSAREVIARCQKFGKRVVAGGALFFRVDPGDWPGVDHLFYGEAERTMPQFLADLEGGMLKKIYQPGEWTDMLKTPPPRLDLVKLFEYTIAPIQLSRGCPHNCNFCSVRVMCGTKMRFKSWEQIKVELDNLYAAGWRSTVMFVDDNLIGSLPELRKILPLLYRWQQDHGFPFDFMAQTTILLANHEDLMDLLVLCRFKKVFIGIETVNEASLAGCNKNQNVKVKNGLEGCVLTIMGKGLQVMAGFIVGFDQDEPTIFREIFNFIQKTGIVVGMLNVPIALPHTDFWEEMKNAKRLLKEPICDILNFFPKMDVKVLLEGFRWLQNELYSPKNYFRRVRNMINNLKPTPSRKPSFTELKAFGHSLWRIGIFSRYNFRYDKLLIRTVSAKAGLFAEAVQSSIQFVHYRFITRKMSKTIRRSMKKYRPSHVHSRQVLKKSLTES